MRFLLKKLQHEDVWERVFRKRLTAPLHLNALSLFVWAFGSCRSRIAFDLIVRQWNAYGILKAADHAKARSTILTASRALARRCQRCRLRIRTSPIVSP